MELEYGSNFVATGGFDIPYTKKFLDLELYDDVAGLDLKLFDGVVSAPAPTATVANFLNYVNNGRYDQIIFNRSIPNFVIQAGGVSNTPSDLDSPLGQVDFLPVDEFDPVDNEPGLSNLRGTIAMARIGGQINSANSEWFINLVDNTSLDAVDEGFTVFGSVIDDGLEIVDQIASFPVRDESFFLGGPFSDLPLADRDPIGGEFITARNLVRILSVIEINRPILRFTPAVNNFGFERIDVPTTGKVIDAVLNNTGNEILNIAPIGSGALSIPFSIQSENCSNASLDPISVNPASSCTVSLKFHPDSTGRFDDDLIIDYTSQVSNDSFSVKYSLIGEGGIPVIAVADTFDVGVSQVDGFSTSKNILVGNSGQASLQVSAISILNSVDFSQTSDCIGNSIFIAPGETCAIAVNFSTTEFGAKTATLSIESNDPANNIVDIVLSGYGDNDADGISSAIEGAAPNAGDNNFDGISDGSQNDVASFVSDTDAYITLKVEDGNVVSNVKIISANQLVNLPIDVEFKHGALDFQIDVGQPGVGQSGVIAEVGLILPVSTTKLTAYYFFGETEDDATPHWYSYSAVRLIPNATIFDPSGKQATRDFIQLNVQDGGPGDADKLINGRILLSLGAPAYSMNASGESSGSSAANALFLLFFTVVLLIKRRYYL